MSERYVARKVLKIGSEKIAPGQPVPDGLGRSRLLRMVNNNEIVPAGSLEAPEPTPNENVNKGDEDADESASKSSEADGEEADAGDDDSGENANESDAQGSEFPKHVGAGTWELSDGTRIAKDDGGKDRAVEQQALLDALDEDEDDDNSEEE